MGDRVLQLLGPSTGGIRRHVQALSQGLEASGWSVEIAGPSGQLEGLLAVDHDVAVPQGTNPSGAMAARRQLRGIATGFDLLHAHGLKAGWVAASLRRRPPLVVSVHNLVPPPPEGSRILRALEARLPRRADQVIAISTEIAERFGGRSNVQVIPPAGPEPVARRTSSEVRTELGLDPEDRLVVTLARLHPQKDLPTLLAALTEIPRAVLCIVGEGPLESELRVLVARSGVGDQVRFLGRRDDPADLLAAADVAVTSSKWESGPLALVEAMKLRRPVVSTPVGLAGTLVEDRVTGRLVPVGDAPAMADAIRWVLEDSGRAEAMGAAGQARATDLLGAESLVARVAGVYRTALAR